MRINELAKRAFKNALNRGKTTRDMIHHDDTVNSLAEEFLEFVLADEKMPSPHIPSVSHAVEELTDILITCMTELCRRDINVEEVVLEKIRFNENRIIGG